MINKLFSTLITLELLCSFSGFHNISIIQNVNASESCSGGMVFSESLNRCILEKEVVSSKTDAQECEGLEDDAKSDCFEANAKKKLADTPASQEAKSSMMMPMIVTLGSAFFWYKSSKSGCGTISLPLMTAGGATSLLGEFMSQSKYKKALEAAQKKYKERTESDDYNEKEITDVTSSNQVAAFDLQIDQEKARGNAHKTRKSTYMLASVMYAGAAVMAVVDIAKNNWDPKIKCTASYEPDIPNNYRFTPISPEKVQHYAQIIYNNTFNFFPAANASDSPLSFFKNLIPNFKSVTGIGKATSEGAQRNLITTAVVGGLLAGYSMSVSSKAGKEHEKSEERVKALEQLKKDFLASGGAGFGLCSEDDRSSPSKPACYCYLEDGTQNPQRNDSTICKAAFGSADFASASDYNASGASYTSSGVQGCATKDGQVDMQCDCKNTKDSSGEDSCFSISGGLNLGPLALNKDFKNAVGNASDFVNGKISTAGFDSGSLERLAARINKQNENFIKKNPDAKKANEKILKLSDEIKKRLSRRVASDYKAGKLADFEQKFFGGDGVQTATAEKVAKKLVKPLNVPAPGTISLSGSKKKNNFDSYFDDKEGGVIVEDDSLSETMNAEYEVDDINKNKHHNIFKIISNRYLTSGLPHLFDEKGIVRPEEAAENEIHEK